MNRQVLPIMVLCAVTSTAALAGCSQSAPDAGNTMITGMMTGGAESDIVITAEPSDGGDVLTIAPDERGNFSLRLEPGVTYRLSGKYHPPSQYMMPFVRFAYQNGSSVEEITLRPGENVVLNYELMYAMMTPVITPAAK